MRSNAIEENEEYKQKGKNGRIIISKIKMNCCYNDNDKFCSGSLQLHPAALTIRTVPQ